MISGRLDCCRCSSVVEHLLGKEEATGSIPVNGLALFCNGEPLGNRVLQKKKPAVASFGFFR